ASPAELSMTSRDIRTKSKLRRTSRPVRPSENKIPASISPSLMGITVILSLRFFSFSVFAKAQVICTHQPRQQEHGGQLHANHVRTEQADPDLLRSCGFRTQTSGCGARQTHDFDHEDAGQN